MSQNPQDVPGQGSRVPPPVPPPAMQGPMVQAQLVQPLGYAPPIILSGDLRTVAMRQKAVIYCILGYVVALLMQLALPRELKPLAVLAVVGMGITSMVFVFMLAITVYGTGTGIVLGILTLVPCVGLIILLVVNGKATSVLKAHGIDVGLMGAKQMPAPGVMTRE